MNNLKFKKSLVAVAAGTALAAVGISAANAESLLFPYWSTTNGITSVLSLSTGTVASAATGTTGNIHYVWNYGSSCTHFDNYGSMTSNDLLQQSVVNGGSTWFGDKSTPAYFPNVSGGTYGFLVVTDNGHVAGTAGGIGTMRGQMVIASAANGTVASYSGIPSNAATTEGNFSLLPNTVAGGAVPNGVVNTYLLSWYPSSVVTSTSWYGVVVGNMTSAITAGANWTGTVNYSNNGNVYGRDEDAYSGSMTGAVTCAGMLTPSSFMNSAQIASVTNGGLANVTFTSATAAQLTAGNAAGTGIVMTKLETIAGPYTFVTGEKATSGAGW